MQKLSHIVQASQKEMLLSANINTIASSPINISWCHFKKKSKSHSPKNFYNFKPFKIPLTKADILENYAKSPLKNKPKNVSPQNKLSPLNTTHETEKSPKNNQEATPLKKLKKINISKEIAFHIKTFRNKNQMIEENLDKSLFSPEKSVYEEHPLYNDKFSNNMKSHQKIKEQSLSPKQQAKENLIKIYRLNKNLENTHENDYQKNAIFLTKIFEILKNNPELYSEVSNNIPNVVSKFLFCFDEKILHFYQKICKKKADQITYNKLLDEFMLFFDDFHENNTKDLLIKEKTLNDLRSENKDLKNIIIGYEEKNKKLSEEVQKEIEEKTQIFLKDVLLLY